MFSETPELYDLIYGSFKDYEAESRKVAELLSAVAPGAHTILDVACGTGGHAVHLQLDHGYSVHGLDIEPRFVVLARAKVPEARFSEGDMVTFDLGTRFDVVLCLFSSIGYVKSVPRLEEALRRFRAHLHPGGVVVVEPWMSPDQWEAGRVYVQAVEGESLHVVRMSHSTVDNGVSKLEFHYLLGGHGGIEHRHEAHEMGLFTHEQMRTALRTAGFVDVDLDEEGLTGRGLWVARAPGRPGS